MLAKFLNVKQPVLGILMLLVGFFIASFPFVANAAKPTSASINISPTTVADTSNLSATWTGNNSPTKYWVKIDSIEYDMLNLTSWSATPASLSLSATDHSISVKACNIDGCSVYSPTKTFKVVTKPTSATVNLSPASVPNNMGFTAYWSGNNSPTSYDVRINSDIVYSGTNDSIAGTPDSFGIGVGSYLITSRACNIAGCSGWSGAKTLTVKPAPPTSATINFSPTSLLTTDTIFANWSGNNIPTEYWVKVDAVENNMGSLTAWSGKPTDLGIYDSGPHSISVKACNLGGCSLYSPIKTLTVTSPKPTSASINISPTSVPANGTFSASWSGDNSPTSYKVKINSDVIDVGPVTSWTNTPESLGLDVRSHSISVSACNAYGCSPYSPIKTLTVTSVAIAPTIATINFTPATVALDDTFSATWTGNNSPTSYEVKAGGKIIYTGSDTSWTGTPASLSLAPGNHPISVQACNSIDCSGWSSGKILTVVAEAPTSATVNLSSASVPINGTFSASWTGDKGANKFNVKVGVVVFNTTSTSWTGTPESLGLGLGGHSVSVSACNSYDCSPYSPIKTLTVTSGVPTTAWLSLSDSEITQKAKFTASWSSNNSPASYKVKVDADVFDMGPATSWTGTPEDLSMTVGDHLVYSQGCNIYGCGPWSDAKLFKVISTSSAFIIKPGDRSPSLASISINPSTISKFGDFTASWSSNNEPTSYKIRAGSKEFDMGMSINWTGTPDSLGLGLGVHPVSVQACNSFGCSPWSGIVNLNVTNSSVIPPTTSSVNVTQYYPYTSVLDNITATWTGNNSPTSYNVKVNGVVYDMGNLTTWMGTPTSFGLTPGTHYLYSQACNEGGCSPWSVPVIFTVTGAAPTPTTATITVSPSSVQPTDNITVVWSGNNSPTNYNVMVDSKVYNAGTYFGDGVWTGTPASVGLTPGIHKLYSQACNSGGCSEWSAPATFTVTDPVVAKPTTAIVTVAPGSVPISGLMTASWSGNNNPTYFKMRVGTAGDVFTVGSDSYWTGTPLSIGLSAGFYSVYVQACNALGCSDWSVPAPLTVTGVASGLPPTTASINIDLSPEYVLTPINGFCANWTGDNSPTNYNIKVDGTVYILGSEPSTTWWCGTPSSIGLGAGTYSVSVQACNLSGCSAWSATKPLVVYPIAPAPTISNIYYGGPVMPTETDIITVSWDGNNVPTTYNVMVDSLVYNVSASIAWTGTPESIGLTPGVHKLYSQACNSGGCSPWSLPITVSYSPTGITAPTLTFTASPTTVASGGTTNLTWSTTNVTSCTASGDWSGIKGLSGSEASAPITSTKTYILNCTGTGGNISGSVTVTVAAIPLPVGTLDAGGCLVTIPGTRTCNTTVKWNATGYSNPKVLKDGTTIWTDDRSDGSVTSISFSSRTFHLRDGATFVMSDTASIDCGSGLVYIGDPWTGACETSSGGSVSPAPDLSDININIDIEPNLIRIGQKADIVINVDSTRELKCRVYGVDDSPDYSTDEGVEKFTHAGYSERYKSYNGFSTKKLNAVQNIKVVCDLVGYPGLSKISEARVNVVGNTQEM